MAALDIELVGDLICPWCFIGVRRLDQALAQTPDVEATVTHHPFLLDASVPSGGVDLRERLKRKYGRDPDASGMFARVEAAAKETGIAIDYKKIHRTPNTTAGHTLVRRAAARGTQRALLDSLYGAYFLDGQDIGDPDVLAALGSRHGFGDDEVRVIVADPTELAQTRAEASGWAREGIGGVPFTILGKRYAVSGAQPVEAFVGAIRQALQG